MLQIIIIHGHESEAWLANCHSTDDHGVHQKAPETCVLCCHADRDVDACMSTCSFGTLLETVPTKVSDSLARLIWVYMQAAIKASSQSGPATARPQDNSSNAADSRRPAISLKNFAFKVGA